MKKILLLSLLVTCSSGFAGSFEDMQKLDKEIKNLKSELNLVYKKDGFYFFLIHSKNSGRHFVHLLFLM